MTMNERWSKQAVALDQEYAKSRYNYAGAINKDVYEANSHKRLQQLTKRFGGKKVWRLYPYNNIDLVQTNIRFPDGSMGAWTTTVITPEDAEKEYGKENQVDE